MPTNKVNQSPPIARAADLSTIPAVRSYLGNLVNSLTGALQEDATAINAIIDLQITPQEPTIFKVYLKTALPSASAYVNGMIMVSNDVGGFTPAFSDGINWRRVADRAVIS